MTTCPVLHKKQTLDNLCDGGRKDCKVCLFHSQKDITVQPAPLRAVDLLPENRTMFDVTLLDSVSIIDALRVAASVLTNEQKSIIISSEVEFCHKTGTARVTLGEFIGYAFGNMTE